MSRVSQQAARYTPLGSNAECCGRCRFYMAPSSCGRIVGPVSPRGWCKYYSREMVQTYGGSIIASGVPIPPGATLDLSFMTPGTLDPSITFTRASTATYTDFNGVIQTAAVNAPRWDYTGGALNGLLIEEARTNVLPTSIPGPVWGVGDATLVINAAVAPDGTLSMTRMVEAATTAIHLADITASVTASVTNTVSVYAKAAQVRYLQLFMDNGANVGSWVTFDLQAGTISGPLAASGVALGSASIQPVGNGVYRCVLSGQIGASTTARIMLMTSNVPNPGVFPNYAGNAANGLLIWGAQLEQGAFATSYIPSTSAAVTRTIDQCFIPPANMSPWFASPGGSWFAEFINNNPLADRGSRVIGIHDASFLTPLWVLTTTPELASYDGGQVNTANTVVSGVISKGASSWASGVGRVCLNGGAIASGSMGSGFATLATVGTSIMGGNPGTLGESLTGYIRRVSYWPRVLSDAEMQQVTT